MTKTLCYVVLRTESAGSLKSALNYYLHKTSLPHGFIRHSEVLLVSVKNLTQSAHADSWSALHSRHP